MTLNDATRPHRQRPRTAPRRTGPPDHNPPTHTRNGSDEPPRRINFSIPIPRVSGITALSSSAVLIEIARGDIPHGYVWPSVALAALGAAYDLGRRALDHHRP
ncbi:hypothetical protein ABT072_46715 [Streptomyces sp. NPDC002589]|uniref:hypothetical protein n=1 Tax=Streptomyces sp. NPDC002589 TaxID=3154420 RepID=UPI00331FCCC9